ncbi:TonB-dependent receptor [Pacificimonas flava]|uniref:TonB-dependent receptor n=1 Tax=Pacificimonas flava TaxID=1234595 RepID=M2SDU2_9SPHN|nr:TonB-dependent receptor [Pacificimonas flava]EMD83535.1 TonB-dependent receptor [Pacificimonas flava]MBB5278913.1 outer membrane receptor protein involved in Fe transport [Pacificimonas flava]
MKSIYLLGAAACVLAAPAFAQTVQEAAEPSAPAPRIEDASGNAIVITATRRAETIQDVPISVNVVAGDLIENAGVDDVRALQQVSPSLRTGTGQSSATGTSLSIRGIGTGGDNPGFEPAVGVFIDGVYRARAGVAISELPPVERVEVLRGPQGTLFGRNTSAGALNIVTELPEFDLGGFAQVEYGNQGQLELRGMATGGVNDVIALRVDGVYRERDGYIRDVNTDREFNTIDRYGVRAQALVDNADRLTVRIIGDYYKTDEECCYAVNVAPGQVAPVLDALGGALGLDGIVTPDSPSDRVAAASPNRDLTERVEDWGVSAEVNYDFDFATLTSITAYRDWDALRDQDIDFSGADRAYRDNYSTGLKDFTQEVRLQGTALDDRLDWLVGGFYLNEELTLTDTVRLGSQAAAFTDTIFASRGFELFDTYGAAVPEFGQLLIAPGSPLFNPQLAAAAAANPALLASLVNPIPVGGEGSGQQGDNYTVDTNAIALFTHNVFDITDSLSLTLGLRWNHEEKDISANLLATNPTCDFFLNPANAAYTQTLTQATGGAALLLGCNPTVNSEFNGDYDGGFSDDEFTGTAKLAYNLNGDLLLYGSYDRGYKAGGYNLDRAGFDTALLGGDGAQIEDLQFGAETVDAYEVGFKASISPEFSLNGAAFYQDFTDYQQLVFTGTSFAVENVPKTVSKGVELDANIRPVRDLNMAFGYALTDASFDKDLDLSATPLAGQEGTQLVNIPRHALTGSITWTPPLTADLDMLFHVDGRFQSEVETSTATSAFGITDNKGYGIVNARIGINTTDGRYRLEAFVENLTNTYYNIASFAVPEQTGTFAVYPSPPRYYGLTARVGF